MHEHENRGSPNSSPILEYATRQPLIPVWAVRWGKRIGFIILIPVLLLLAARFIVGRLYPPVPIQALLYNIGDSGVWGGESTISAVRSNSARSPVFRITFEGRNFQGSTFGSGWVVEGRELGRMPWDIRYHEGTFTGRDGLVGSFSSRTRSVIIDYAAKHIVYLNPSATLTIDGVSYSTGNDPVYLRVSQTGAVTQQLTFVP
jgi:hypothetical protein